MRFIDHVISGHSGGADGSGSGRTHKVWNPSTGEVQAEVPLGDAALLAKAVETAKKIQPEWAATNPQRRARVMFEFKRLVEENKQHSPNCSPASTARWSTTRMETCSAGSK